VSDQTPDALTRLGFYRAPDRDGIAVYRCMHRSGLDELIVSVMVYEGAWNGAAALTTPTETVLISESMYALPHDLIAWAAITIAEFHAAHLSASVMR
jgi:hypothetical protein